MDKRTENAVQALADAARIIQDQQLKKGKAVEALLKLEGLLAGAYDRTGQTLNTNWNGVHQAHNLLHGILWVLTDTFPHELGLHDLPPSGPQDAQP